MAADNRRYSANGAAAYDVYSGAYAYNERYDGSALRRPERQHLPEERPVPRRQERVKVKRRSRRSRCSAWPRRR